MEKIKILRTVEPEVRISESQWMNEFNIGRRLHDLPNGFGMTFLEYIDHIKKIRSEKTGPKLVWQNNR